MAGFEVITYGRFWVITEGLESIASPATSLLLAVEATGNLIDRCTDSSNSSSSRHEVATALRAAASGGSCRRFAAKNAPTGQRQISTSIRRTQL